MHSRTPDVDLEKVDVLRLKDWYKLGFELKLPGFTSLRGCSNLIKRMAFYEYEADEYMRKEKRKELPDGI